MHSNSQNQNEPQLPQEDHISIMKRTKTSKINTTRRPESKGKELEDRMSRYFGSDLPWTHVDAMSSSKATSSQENGKKD
ncbi:hypothetical protein CGMCC3_g729 [Colletotrichum fructicola]|uniref:Uncharacterized protein n=1 Tax=Colletotrichum fructicola (strain Nara gc5) TaxID=1213859 RepID=L2FPU4_COLFN|nr:uncharacterized protein CGMCC3_g729 [Colletotrichum fructicola]KAE9583320.1 hypothetical protein CGMCC3_g729 [Colletotrichum fructicola]KAI8277034.1 hypothetical protein K4K60_007266 [Colletotrichum sp. SAR11_57]